MRTLDDLYKAQLDTSGAVGKLSAEVAKLTTAIGDVRLDVEILKRQRPPSDPPSSLHRFNPTDTGTRRWVKTRSGRQVVVDEDVIEAIQTANDARAWNRWTGFGSRVAAPAIAAILVAVALSSGLLGHCVGRSAGASSHVEAPHP